MIGKGSILGKGLGSLTSIPRDLISPVGVDGLGQMRSFYISLSTNDMIYRVEGTGSKSNEAVQQASTELELYEGESVHGFPFPASSTEGAYIGPSSFIGSIIYDKLPCKPLSDYGVLYCLPWPFIPSVM